MREALMTSTQQALLLEFADVVHTFVPAQTSGAAYAAFNGAVVPALERLHVEGYLRVQQREPNAMFTPGGEYAAYHCELTPLGRAARLELLQAGVRGAPAA
jgi:hypothetical protein